MNKFLLLSASIGFSCMISCQDLEEAWNQKVFKMFQSQNKHINIVIKKGNIVETQVDVIVNAANTKLRNGGGVCGAIFDAAGKEQLSQACARLDSCHVGQACITDSFCLKEYGIEYIIHAVGPDCRQGIIKKNQQEDVLLKSAYKNALELTKDIDVKSIAFPFISSGNYGFPKNYGAQIAIESIIEYLQDNKNSQLQSVYFVVYSSEDFDLFVDFAKQYCK